MSLKTSNPLLVNKLYESAAKKIGYPFHLGVTEAGIHDDAIIKHSIGLSPLLMKGIGDTIRVSISGDPLIEPIIAKKILNNVNLYKSLPNLITCPNCGRLQ
ncbi:hypothetical protein FACS1894218_5210 [Bacilli bacterium]|nr:hypothetical protein FACS1894218_5210 [Bacilli bacterium]